LTSPRPLRIAFGVAVAAATVWLVVYPLYSHNIYWQGVLFFAFLFAVSASGWNIISGYAGYVSLGQWAFVGLGAYTTGLLAIHLKKSPWYFVPASAAVAAIVAVLVGVVIMRTRGHAFVIITIAFLLLLQLIALNWGSFTGGSAGLTLPLPQYAREWQYTPFYYAMFGLMALSVLMSWGIRRTKFGTGLIAIREDEDKAAAVGVNVPVYKVLAFAASGVLIGAAGGVYGYFLTFIDYRSMFDIQYSVLIVLAVLLGGRATIFGPILGAFLVELIREETNVHSESIYSFLTRLLHVKQESGATTINLVLYGGLMAVVVLFMPRGILPTTSMFLERFRERREGGAPSGAIDLRPTRVEVREAVAGEREAERPVLLEVKGLAKSFGGVHAVDDLSFSVRQGTITALIGPNGSGKTTAFNLIVGMMRADRGEVRFDGERIDRVSAWGRAHRGLGRTFQITRLFRDMTVVENVVAPLRAFRVRQLFGDAVAGHEAERAHELLEFVGMRRFADKRAAALSFGQQKLVELAQVLMLDPKLILLDEPAGGINPTLIDRLVEKIRELNAIGKTFLIVEHNMPLVAQLCDPVIVLARGKCIASGPALEIQRDPVVLDAYLGEGWTVEEVVHA
jgi:ABC-type branched-subunit amino acid transport system ATPase component/ABC-type branched-subunit amino acid transport system permease subunit